jgi:hypothetical protein
MRILNYLVFNNSTVGTGIASNAIEAGFMLNASLIATVTGTSPVATLALEVSNDKALDGDLGPFTPTNWSAIATVSVTANGVYMIPKTDVCYQWLRVNYIYGSGTATTITANIKTNGM